MICSQYWGKKLIGPMKKIGAVAIQTALYMLRIPILSIYNISDRTREMANAFLVVLSVAAAGMSCQMSTACGIIRGVTCGCGGLPT